LKERLLDDPIPNGGYSERPLPSPVLRNEHPPHRLRTVALVSQVRRQLFQPLKSPFTELLHAHFVDARSALMGSHLLPGFPEVGERIDFVDQRMPFMLSLCSSLGGKRRAACKRSVLLGFLGFVFRRQAEREHELAYSDLYRLLVHPSLACPSRLRPLRSSRLSPGVHATMSRSDSSAAPKPLTIRPGFRPRVIGSGRTAEVSLGHTRRCSPHPGVNHTTGSCAGLHPAREARPPVMPKHVHFGSGLRFGYDPSPEYLAVPAVFSYRRCSLCTGPPGGT